MTETKIELAFSVCEEKKTLPVIIVAAGSSQRMGKNKLFMEIAGIPTIARTLLCFERSDKVSDIIVVTQDEYIPEIQRLCEQYEIQKLSDITLGGNTRQESVLKGFERLDKSAEDVLIHDGARPLTDNKTIALVADALEKYSAVTCGVPLKDTVKEICPDGTVVKTLDRNSLFAVQTPQGVRKADYLAAVEKIGDISAFTDDTSIMEAAGYEVLTVMGSYKNIKITTPEDITAAESYIDGEEE